MAKYLVTFIASVDTVVEIDCEDGLTEDEVVERAEAAFQTPSLCHQCNDEMQLNDWSAFGRDGKPVGVRALWRTDPGAAAVLRHHP